MTRARNDERQRIWTGQEAYREEGATAGEEDMGHEGEQDTCVGSAGVGERWGHKSWWRTMGRRIRRRRHIRCKGRKRRGQRRKVEQGGGNRGHHTYHFPMTQ